MMSIFVSITVFALAVWIAGKLIHRAQVRSICESRRREVKRWSETLRVKSPIIVPCMNEKGETSVVRITLLPNAYACAWIKLNSPLRKVFTEGLMPVTTWTPTRFSEKDETPGFQVDLSRVNLIQLEALMVLITESTDGRLDQVRGAIQDGEPVMFPESHFHTEVRA